MLFKNLYVSSLLLMPILALSSSPADAWQAKLGFNNGPSGTAANGSGAFTEGTAATYNSEHVYEGSYAIKNSISSGDQGFGRWGGIYNFPSKLAKGNEIWYRVRTYFPSGFNYSASPRLKFLRTHVETASGTHIGYDDWYINIPGSGVPFSWIFETEDVWHDFGNSTTDPIKYDKWETYEMYIKYDNVPASQGGMATVRMWKDGRLIGEAKNRKTLRDSTDKVYRALLFTYWNGNSPATQSMWIDDVVIQSDTPAARDAAGNPYIGVGAAAAVADPNPPKAPLLSAPVIKAN